MTTTHSNSRPAELNGEDSTAAVIYLRVSSRRQMDTAIDIDPDGLSIATQREECTAKAQQIGASIAREPFVEPGVSAKTITDRPVFRELLTYLHEQPDIKYVITYNRARAFRNQFDAAIVQIQLQKLGVRLVTVKDDFGEGPHAVAMEGMLDIMNGLQNTLQGLDIQTKMLHKAMNGGTNGAAKVGYRNVRVEHEGKQINTVQLDPVRAPLVLKAWELYATGDYTLERLEATMADLGLTIRGNSRWPERPISLKLFHRMFTDLYYVGYVTYKGEVYPGRHEPIVTQELFNRVQDVKNLRSNNGQRDRVHQHLLKGMLFCARCEQHGRSTRLIYTEAKGRGGRYSYFLCRGRQEAVCDLPYLPAADVENAVAEHYRTLKLPTEFIQTVRELLDATLADDQTSTRELHTRLQRHLKELDDKEERLIDLAADGMLNQDRIKSRLRSLQADRASTQASLGSTSAELATGAKLLNDALDLVADPYQMYLRAASVPAARRSMNQTFYQSFHLDQVGVTADVKNPPFDDFDNGAQVFRQLKARSSDNQSNASPPTETTKKDPRITDVLDHLRQSSSEPTLAGVLSVQSSSTDSLVELRGIEPLTSSMRTKRATNCATAPCHRLSGARQL